jgi:RsiW-degrading membrane proteinase PrsW (M82 family)
MYENPNPFYQQPLGSHRGTSVVVTTPTGKNPSIVKYLVLGVLVLGMLVMFFLTVGMIGFLNTGIVGLIVGMITAIIPVPIYLAFVIWIDRYEPEPWWMLALTFGWGATGAVFISFILNTIGGMIVGSALGPAAGQIYGASISAPIVEETAKALALFSIFFFRRKEFDGMLDGIVYAGMVGLGFAMTENFSYYGGFGPLLFLLRGTFLAFAHPLFTSMTGIGLGIATESKNILVKIAAPIVGLILAMLLHSFNNSIGTILVLALGDVGGLLGLLVLIVSIPFCCLCVMGLAGFALYRESKKIKEFLQPDIAAGRLTAQEVQRIGSIFGRIGASFRAISKGGFQGWSALGRFHHIATELAFFRSNVARGIYLQDANAIAQENEYTKVLAELRPQLPPV